MGEQFKPYRLYSKIGDGPWTPMAEYQSEGEAQQAEQEQVRIANHYQQQAGASYVWAMVVLKEGVEPPSPEELEKGFSEQLRNNSGPAMPPT